ncbi:MAG: type II toxin-antitoxin system HicA family toxin [Clostridia bacterium]|nr:type II toxin-antitoxin system HicA family toxin [Clostridia bacterium]
MYDVYSSREVIRMLKADGWCLVNVVGDHHQFRHRTKKGRITVTHSKKDVPVGTLKAIEKQSGVRF